MKFPLEEVTHTDNIKLSDDGRSVVIIDQTLLPNRLEYIALTTREEMFEAIAMLRVRGAPAIGICAGYCAYCPGPSRPPTIPSTISTTTGWRTAAISTAPALRR